MNRKMADAVLQMSEYNRFSKGIFGWVGFKTKWLDFENVERSAGETKWSVWKLFRYSLEGTSGFSVLPLALASVLGILFCGLSALVILVIIIRTLVWGDPVSGWPSWHVSCSWSAVYSYCALEFLDSTVLRLILRLSIVRSICFGNLVRKERRMQIIKGKKKIRGVIYLLLCLLTVFVCWLFVGRNGVFGAKVDWISQHSVIPDYFRQQFYDTGELFPEFAANLGGGQNIYNFSYYLVYIVR